MLNLEDAISKVQKEYLKDWSNEDFPEDELIVLREDIIDRPKFWVIRYTSKLWNETGEMKYAIAGNAPIIVNKNSGEMIETGTAHSIDYYIDAYEKAGQIL